MTDRLDLPIRLRRNRSSEAIRQLLQETRLHASDFVAPFFIIEGHQKSIPIRSMPGVHRLSIDMLLREVESLHRQGIQAVALFPNVGEECRTDCASEAWNPEGLVPRAIYAIKQAFPSICVIADIALDPYTSHGHDGLLNERGDVDNDITVERLIRMASLYAAVGVDMVAPSDMMDGRVGAIRNALDEEGYERVNILSYSAKYASSLYAPFRDAVGAVSLKGDKKSYQLNPANRREALLEAVLDETEGADILMVKPALLYLDIIRDLRETTHRPIAAYHVSGEYAMVLAAHQMGYLDASKVFYESLQSIKRAGADLIFSYAIPYVLDRL